MSLPYVISANMSREDARDLILRLADDEAFRDEFQTNTQQVLHEYGIEVTPQSLPEQVVLPDPEAIREFLAFVERRIVPESASPFAVLVLVLAFAAMPVMMGDRPSRDGAG
jgi:hypothetical protein